MIRFDRVTKRYPNGREALSELSFELAEGEMAFLTGRSGAGKSSVLKLIALLERPTRGQVLVNGEGTARLRNARVPAFRRRVGVVFQDHRLLMDRPVFDNVALPLIVADTSFREIDRRVRAALDQVGLLGRERTSPQELSVGEQQRVGIARAIVTRPPVLVADEPTGNLDAALAVEVILLLRRLNELGTTVLIATHDQRLVRESGLREIALHDGRLLDQPALPLPVIEAHR
jgi:cell division transport system ATP-binding protein